MPRGDGLPTDEAIPALADALAYYDQADVERWFERNKRMTGQVPKVYPSTVEDVRAFRKVPNEPFRKAYIQATQALTMGIPTAWGITDNRELYALLRDELEAVRARNPEKKIGPTDVSTDRLSEYLQDVLGMKERVGKSISVAWLIQYEVAEALCKTLGLTPHQVGV